MPCELRRNGKLVLVNRRQSDGKRRRGVGAQQHAGEVLNRKWELSKMHDRGGYPVAALACKQQPRISILSRRSGGHVLHSVRLLIEPFRVCPRALKVQVADLGIVA